MVGVLSRGEHGRAAPCECLVGLEGIALGLSKVLLSPSTLSDPFSGDCGLPRVRGPGQALAAMLPGPPECIGVGMAGDSRHVLLPPWCGAVCCAVSCCVVLCCVVLCCVVLCCVVMCCIMLHFADDI